MKSEPHNPPDAVAQLRHDLRTPVNHIIGYSEMLIEDASGSGSDISDLKKIHSAAGELLTLINTRLHLGGDLETQRAMPSIRAENMDSHQDDCIFSGRVLAVDDNPGNLDVLERRLIRHGLDVETAESGMEALNLIRSRPFDLVLLDVMMPEVDGYSVLKEMKSSSHTKDIPVIMISALDQMESVVRCIEAGAEDYLPKPFNPTLLRARIGACLEKKSLRDAEQGHLRKIEETQRRLDKELAEAAAYVRSILPPPVEAPLRVDWIYRPSSELAGDSFGYHWIDSEHFAVYLLDVCGHGVGACLLSVSAINVIRSGALPGVDFQDPGAVLTALNDAFPMERQNNLYFTLWYGVYHAPSHMLTFASGGHPPALLVEAGPTGTLQSRRLTSNGMIIGVMEDMPFAAKSVEIPAGSHLFIPCDGCYEIRNGTGEMQDYDAFETVVCSHTASPDALQKLESWAIEMRGSEYLEDDFSLIQIQFPK